MVNLTGIFGYKFGYRHPFGLFTVDFTKPLIMGNLVHVTLRSIAPILDRFTVFIGNSKSADRKVIGVRPPLPAPSQKLLFRIVYCDRRTVLLRLVVASFRYKFSYRAHL